MLSLAVKWRGAVHSVETHVDSSLAELASLLAEATGGAQQSLRLLVAGRALPLHGEGASQSVRDASLDKARAPLLLLGSTRAELEAVLQAPTVAADADKAARLPTAAHEQAVARQRRSRAPAPVARPPSGPFSFQDYQTLAVGTLQPSSTAALHLLYRLASDVGIVAVMQRRRYSVRLLSEMPPEGKVGVSEVCVLGYNVNAGQEISLRLRTDDMRGFRRFERIRETLIHELAHNVFSEHDLRFKALNSELTREAHAADWTTRAGRTLGEGDSWQGEEEEDNSVMALTAQQSGKALGGAAHAATMDPRAAAAQAAAKRSAADAAARAEAEMASEAQTALATADVTPQPVQHAVPETAHAAGCGRHAAGRAASLTSWAPLCSDAVGFSGASSDPQMARIADAAQEAGARAASAASALALRGGEDAQTALRTLATVLRNALENPTGTPQAAHFRTLRRGAGAFEARAGRYPEALEVLRVAGFVEAAADSGRMLRLTRDDPALLWLALSAVNDQLALQRVR